MHVVAYLFVSTTIISIIVDVKNRKKISLMEAGMVMRGPPSTVHGTVWTGGHSFLHLMFLEL